MTDRSEATENFKAILAEALNISAFSIRDDDALEDIISDEYDAVNVCFAIEDEFGVFLTDEEFDNLLKWHHTVAEMAAAIEGRMTDE